jgi:hypothetical protein
MNEIWPQIVEDLRSHRIEFQAGLSAAETAQIEREFSFQFPPDLREFLQTAMPIGEAFPDWRNGDRSALRGRLLWPVDSICFDVENNESWLHQWGVRPTSVTEACALARSKISAAPPLIPIFAHRYIPSLPRTPGNPVLSVWQTDIIYYGNDLTDYLAHEFEIANPLPCPPEPRSVEFWTDFLAEISRWEFRHMEARDKANE